MELKLKWDEVHIDWDANNRGRIRHEHALNLAKSIKQEGLHQLPLIRKVKPHEGIKEKYDLVAGYTRCYACMKILEWKEMPFTLSEKELSKTDAAIVNLQENIDRHDLTIMQEANALSKFVRMGLDRGEIEKRIGRSTGWVQPRLYLLELEPEIQQMAEDEMLTNEQIRKLYSMKNRRDRFAFARAIKDKRLKGYSGPIKIKVPDSVATRKSRAKISRARSAEEIQNLIDHYFESGGYSGIHTRMLAWAAGNISDLDLMTDLQTHFSEIGKVYEVRKEGIPKAGELSIPGR